MKRSCAYKINILILNVHDFTKPTRTAMTDIEKVNIKTIIKHITDIGGRKTVRLLIIV